MSEPVTAAKRRVLETLKRLGPTPAVALARRLGLTDVAVRQHLGALEGQGLVEQAAAPRGDAPRGRGRPSAVWALADLAQQLFPDRHADLTVNLISATRRALGPKGLEKVVAERGVEQLRGYRKTLPPKSAPLAKRVEALAAQRSAEGYMAEVRREGKGGFLLVEHHCPICDAARTCQGLCASELKVFRRYLGPDVRIERVEHLLSGGERCAYRIEPARAARPRARRS